MQQRLSMASQSFVQRLELFFFRGKSCCNTKIRQNFDLQSLEKIDNNLEAIADQNESYGNLSTFLRLKLRGLTDAYTEMP